MKEITWEKRLYVSLTEGGLRVEQQLIKLLNRLQNDFPITSRPYLKIADELGMTEEEVILLIKLAKEQGLIRRLGGVFNSRSLGYTSLLCALSVPEDKIQETSDIINQYEGVTHNYLRSHHYNMWFTITAPNEERMTEIIDEIKKQSQIKTIMQLPAVNTFKIRVNFNLEGV